MNSDLAMVLALLGAAIFMFVLNRPRMDAVGLLMILALSLSGVVGAGEALAGFGDPNVVLIAVLFVVGEGLARTGVAQKLGDWLAAKAGRSEARLIVFLMVAVAAVGSVMSSTGVVAIFIPIALRIARRTGFSAGRLMMPLSVAALISGMMTLVATAPNLVAQGELERRGFEGFHFFSFAPFGLPILACAVVYMLFARRFLSAETVVADDLSRPRFATWIKDYALAGRDHRLRLRPDSPLVGRTLDELDLRGADGANILAIERRQGFASRLIQPRARTTLAAEDVLLLDLSAASAGTEALTARYGLEHLPLSDAYYTDYAQRIGMAELMIPASSDLIGKTVVETKFRSRHGITVIGLKRGRKAMAGGIVRTPLELGDTLLVIGSWRDVKKLQGETGEVVALGLPRESEDALSAPEKAPYALLALAVMVGLMVSGLTPNVMAALIAALLMGAFGCVDFQSAYRAIHWKSLVLIVGMLPFSLALQRTGGVDLAAGALLEVAGTAGPRGILAAIFLVTALLGLFISNTATAVLMAPVALSLASTLGASPYPFAMTVALAASAAFVTPVSSPVNTLVVGPGHYGFMDFVKIGGPLALLVMVLCVALVPVVLPF
ncbi:SLC13 family permease [Neomegalonema perideroedes]|uniref:SLC13 family permease n=1 Tax=Neomegalonema perideroedes TaxID=217219 RepID=UPI00036D6EDB|nr:SLC13 family permease [Neomegalonema perideroedes]